MLSCLEKIVIAIKIPAKINFRNILLYSKKNLIQEGGVIEKTI